MICMRVTDECMILALTAQRYLGSTVPYALLLSLFTSHTHHIHCHPIYSTLIDSYPSVRILSNALHQVRLRHVCLADLTHVSACCHTSSMLLINHFQTLKVLPLIYSSTTSCLTPSSSSQLVFAAYVPWPSQRYTRHPGWDCSISGGSASTGTTSDVTACSSSLHCPMISKTMSFARL